MKSQIVTAALALLILTFGLATAGDKDWAIKGEYIESCSCSVPCPCTFGSSPTKKHCDANGLLIIDKGHFKGVRLDGISVVMAMRLGDWGRIYVSEGATDAQADAVLSLLKEDAVFGPYFPATLQILSVEKVPIKFERDQSHVKFSAANTVVEIEPVAGLDGEPIKIRNLPLSVLSNHIQHKSVTHRHESDGKQFSYSGTNGLTSKFDFSSK